MKAFIEDSKQKEIIDIMPFLKRFGYVLFVLVIIFSYNGQIKDLQYENHELRQTILENRLFISVIFKEIKSFAKDLTELDMNLQLNDRSYRLTKLQTEQYIKKMMKNRQELYNYGIGGEDASESDTEEE